MGLLLRGAVVEDRVDAEPDPGFEGDADGLIDPAEFLDRDAQHGEVAAADLGAGALGAAGAAELLRHHQAEQAELTEFGDELSGEVRVLVPLGDPGLDLGLGELPH